MRLPDIPAIIPLLPYQRADIESNARLRWCCWSRQSGKSFTKSLRRILRGLERRRTQIFLSAGERQSRELMTKARQHCETLKLAADFCDERYFAGTSFKQLEIQLPNRVRIIGLPANPQTARGFTGDVLLDEFAMHADDREIWAAMFPTLLRGDGECDVASTPKGRGNLFYRLRDNDAFAHSTVTLPDAVAAGLDVDLDEIRRSMADEQLFRQEFLCEFIDEATAFLTYDQIAACEDATLAKFTAPRDLAQLDADLFAGVDIGRHRDLTVIWIVSRCELPIGACPPRRDFRFPIGGQSEIQDLKFEISNIVPPYQSEIGIRNSEICFVTRSIIEMSNAPFRAQQSVLREVLSLRNLRRCCIDAGGLGMQLAESAVEEFGAHRVEPITFTAALKSQLAGALRIAVEDARIRIPVDEAIRNDWHSVERAISAAGHIRFDAPRHEGSHADRFWASALALHAAEAATTGPLEMLRLGPLTYSRSGAW